MVIGVPFRPAFTGAVFLLLGGAACSSSSTANSAPPVVDSPDAGVDAGADTAVEAPASWTVLVVAPSVGGPVAAPGANVIVHPPNGGEPLEAVTDDRGIATFPLIDWSKGTGAVSTYGDSKKLVATQVGVNADLIKAWPSYNPAVKLDAFPKADFLAFLLTKDGPRASVSVTGAITGKQNPDNLVLVSALGAFSTQPSEGPGDYLLKLEPGMPFRLIATEWAPPATPTVSARGFEGTVNRWVYKDSPAVSGGTATLDIDLATATPLTPKKATGKLVIPGGDNGPLGGDSMSRLFAAPAAYPASHFARYTKMDISADKGSFEYEAEYVEPENVQLLTRYFILRTDGAASTVARLGPPENNAVIDGFLDPPPITVSAQPLYEPWVEEGTPGADVLLRAVVLDAAEAVWIVTSPPGASSVTPPKLPANAAKLVQGAVKGQLVALSGTSADTPLFLHAAFTRTFNVSK